MKWIIISGLLLSAATTHAQGSYKDSMTRYIKRYINDHEVVTGDDKKYLSFYPIDERYKVTAKFERAENSKWFSMETSGAAKQVYRVYGTLKFSVNDTAVVLPIYQSQGLMQTQEFKDHLFVPFTDFTSGEETYASGRYIDLNIPDIVNDKVVLDFNKAYNPYCAYVSGKYNCPIPPRANQLEVNIKAGEKIFAHSH